MKEKKQRAPEAEGASGTEAEKELRGRPLGRPAGPEEVIGKARRYGPACVETLADVMNNGPDASRLAAAKELLDRGYGKARQEVNLSGTLEHRHELPEEVAAVLERLEVGRK